jgi:hypothetical protein
MQRTPPVKPGNRGRPPGALRLALVAALAFATCGPSVIAQDESPAAFFRADRERMQRLQQARPAQAPRVVIQRPTHLIRRGAPVRGFAREVPLAPQSHENLAVPREPTNSAPREEPVEQPSQTADAPVTPAVPIPPPAEPAPPAIAVEKAPTPVARPAESTFTALVIGDSLGTLLGQGLTEAFADQPEVTILRKARENTGLVRDDYFDWAKGVRDLVAGNDKINIAIMMVGSNDRQQIRDGSVSLDNRLPRWKVFKDKKIPLVWVGLPIMKSERFSADMESFNEIYQDRAGKAGATFVDTWEAFLDDRGQFAAYGPDVNGQFQKLRSGDGVHFTKPGARKLAHFVESEIRHAIEDARPQAVPQVAAIVPVNPAPSATKPASGPSQAPPGPIVALPAPAAPAAVVIPVKPAAGPVSPLTGPVISPGGMLVTRSAKPGAPAGSQAVVERAIVQGQPFEARPGRADDFSWPRN